jgi:hypothetical protein
MSERRKLGAPPLSLDEAQRTVDAVHECLEEGFEWSPRGREGAFSARNEAARRLSISHSALHNRLKSAQANHGLEIDRSRFRVRRQDAPFTIDELPHDGEPTAEELIEALKARSRQRQAHEEAKRLMDVRITIPGPIGIAWFGDPHVDSPGCDWTALERDVRVCRETPGVLAVSVGDSRDNWVGRLMGLYANAEVTAKQSITLIEWLFTQLPWLLTVGGNHDKWHSEGGDAAEIIHRLRKCPGLYENDGARLRLNLPSGATANMHVRHDFPGQSQFNGGHAFVRETLFGYRDHLLACGHRHASAYTAIWHNDPRRLCQGFRCGSYKVIDSFAKEKHFKEENWAPAMGAIIDPAQADDPVRYIKAFYSLEEMAEVLTWRRARFERGKSAA